MRQWKLSLLMVLVAGCGPEAPPSSHLDGSTGCEGVTCSNHGTCVNDPDGPRCECETGYVAQGLDCVPDPCTPNPCTHPPDPACQDEATRLVFDEVGTCTVGPNGAECDYGTGRPEPCPANTRCANGECVATNQAPPAPGDLVISEIMKDPVGIPDKNGEWFEIVNVSNHEVDLVELVVEDDGGNQFAVVSSEAIMLQPHEYFVFGPNADRGTNGGVTVDYEYFGLMLNNDGDGLRLTFHGELIDEVHYDDTHFPPAIGASLSLDPDHLSAADNDAPSVWCEATQPYDAQNLGTPGAPNDSCANNACNPNPCTEPPASTCNGSVRVYPTLQTGTCTVDASGDPVCDYGLAQEDCSSNGQVCVDGECVSDPCNPNPCTEPPAPTCNGSVRVYPTLQTGTCTVDASGQLLCDYGLAQEDCGTSGLACVDGECRIAPPGPGDLVITEFMANPDGVSDDVGEWFEVLNVTDHDIDIQGLELRDDGSDVYTLPVGNPIVVAAGQYFLFGATADLGVPGFSDVDFVYTQSAFRLANSSDEIRLLLNGVVIDELRYNQGQGPGISRGASTELDPAVSADATANDDGSNWCYATSVYDTTNGNKGTPGGPNDPCQ